MLEVSSYFSNSIFLNLTDVTFLIQLTKKTTNVHVFFNICVHLNHRMKTLKY